ncbi:HdeD family acid-resistance protein [Leptolyngbya sp. FACHB-36]|uniref:HdeD family acid-resistance protein n=1 Tax=Leptolyngbya sp. FACHB-36 TaxID=2692808 RepID=UPI0016811AFC|nr:HdeD family acid-resistance protein [Leptolyngbya sp. FACHB-36]MBD2019842.1 HdeD family acid-resistance protein [Leptolyngbya sp. FACHB-36]
MTTNISTEPKKRNNSLIIGVLLIVLGIASLILPQVSTLVTETWIALILASSGVAKLVYAFQTRDQGGFIWKLLLGTLYIATGAMLFFYPLTGVLTLTLLLGSFLLTEGVFNLILAFRLRPQQNWTWVLVDGIVTLVLGAMIWFQFPFNAPWLIGTLVGVSILFSGISRLGLSLNGRSTIASSDPSNPAPSV